MSARSVCGGLLILVLAGCSDLFTPGYDYATVHVMVSEPSGVGIAGVPLVLYTGVQRIALGTTNGSGRYDFRFVPPGNYGVAALRPERYTAGLPFVDQIDAIEGSERSVSLVFCEGVPLLELRAVDDEGRPVPGVVFTLFNAAGINVRQVTSDATGKQEIGSFPEGLFRVEAMPPQGYSLASGGHPEQTVHIRDCVPYSVTFVYTAS